MEDRPRIHEVLNLIGDSTDFDLIRLCNACGLKQRRKRKKMAKQTNTEEIKKKGSIDQLLN